MISPFKMMTVGLGVIAGYVYYGFACNGYAPMIPGSNMLSGSGPMLVHLAAGGAIGYWIA